MAANPPELFGDVGTVKTALKAILTGPDLERQLAAVDKRFSDGLVLERFSDEQVETNEHEGAPPQYPFIELVATTTDLPDTDEESAVHAIDVIVWATGDTEQVVSCKVERYLLAIRKTLRNGTLMPFVGNAPIRVAREEYGIAARRPGTTGPFIKAGGTTIRIGTFE